MKIGLCMAFKGVNYGMLLQAYATQQIIEKLGYETEIIDYKRAGTKGIKITPSFFMFAINYFFESRKKRKRQTAVLDKVHADNVNARKEISAQFTKEKYHNIVKCTGLDELQKRALTYNGVLVGSDQVWSPGIAYSNFMTLRFAPDSMNKISYAPSLGVSKYPAYCKRRAADFIKRINHVSVREEQGRKIINEFCDKKVEVVVDPTYLLTKEEWLERIPNEREVEEKYVLCYFLGGTKEHKELARKYADKHNLKLVSILSTESVSDIDISYADQVITGAGPERFINLIRNAECVLTDSFHGVAFSVINEKQFYVFYRTLVGSKGSRNSRIDNILNMWDLKERLVLNESTVEDFSQKEINYAKVNEILTKKREHSLDFLKRALEDCK